MESEDKNIQIKRTFNKYLSTYIARIPVGSGLRTASSAMS